MVVKFTATSRPTASDVSRSPTPPRIHRWYANPLRMLDPTIMMQSRAHARGSTLQNGIRQDAGVSEMASATAVFSLGQIGIMRRPLCYSTTLMSALFPRAAILPDRSLAHLDNKSRRTVSMRYRIGADDKR